MMAIETARDLARLEGLMCGISGTNVAAARRKSAYWQGKPSSRFCRHRRKIFFDPGFDE
ncbi:MAG: hypothetical protein ACLUFM_00850 [Lachnospiraceae bacterium]